LRVTTAGLLCASCHDQLGDGRRLEPDFTGNVDRPVVGCESCHGGGADHFGAGEIPYPKPGAERCGQCHNSTFDHNAYHPNGDDIYEEYIASPHTHSANHGWDHNNEEEMRARCSRCHTNEGFRKYRKLVPGTLGKAELTAAFALEPNWGAEEDITAVGCGTCHDPHITNAEKLEVMDASTMMTVIYGGTGLVFNGNTLTSLNSLFKTTHTKIVTGDELTVIGGLNGGTYIVDVIHSDTALTVAGGFIFATPAGDPVVFDISRLIENSPQFNTCTACHQLIYADGTAILTGETPDSYHATSHSTGEIEYERNIVDTHAAVPGDLRGNWKYDGSERYNFPNEPLIFVNKEDEHACAACHNPHAADNTANEQWARSSHGDLDADPWVHYNWKTRTDCQRCHTSTGFMNFSNALIGDTVYHPEDNDFSYMGLEPVDGLTTTGRNEALYCWACHADVRGSSARFTTKFKDKFRDPAANKPLSLEILHGYTAMSGDTIIVGSPSIYDGATLEWVIADPGGSNVCITCHGGRENGSAVANKSDGTFDGNTLKPVNVPNAHYLVAAGILYRYIGYEYHPHDSLDGSTDYGNASYFAHDKIGTLNADTTVIEVTGMNGPCVGCHMHANPEKHLFSPVEHDGDTVTLVSTACAVCHDAHGHPLDGADIKHEEHLFHLSLTALENMLALRNIDYKGGHPYFSETEADWTTAYDGSTTLDPIIGRNNMGAAFNWNTLHHEPGAFAHNRYYTKRLIYDSIDWLDDNYLNGSVDTTLPSLISGSTDLADVQGYLLNSSNGRP